MTPQIVRLMPPAKPSPAAEITTEKGFEMPRGGYRDKGQMGELRSAFRNMEVGDSFYWPNSTTHLYLAAEQIEARITCRKLDKGGWRVWLREKASK